MHCQEHVLNASFFKHLFQVWHMAWWQTFLPCDAMHNDGPCCRPVSVHPFVHLSHLCIVSTRLKISSNFFLGPVAPSF